MNVKTKLTSISIKELLAMELPPQEELLSPWLPQQGLAMIHAYRGIGKTHVALGIAYAVATGREFLGWQAKQARKVLYLDGEMPASSMKERLLALENIYGETDNCRIITPDFQAEGMPDLSSFDGQNEIYKQLGDAELIIIDNISTLCRSGKENESESWVPIQNWALRMRAEKRSVLFIHHAGKSGQQRGTSKREDILDTVIELKRADNYQPKDGAQFEVHFRKARGLWGEATEPFVAQLLDENGQARWLRQAVTATRYQQVIALHQQGLKQCEIAQHMQIDKSGISRYIQQAKAEGKIYDAV